MELKRIPLLLLLPLAMSACDSSQPSYSAANSAAPPPPAPVAATAPAPASDAQASAPVDAAAVATPSPAEPKAHVVAMRNPDSMPMSLGRLAAMKGGGSQAAQPADPIGVGPCDDYVTRYRACMNGMTKGSVPNAERFALMRTLTAQTRQWRADVSAGKTGTLSAVCSDATKEARTTWTRLGCTTF